MQWVVGAAIIRGGRVLAARRTSPAAAAGKWEFPGGKVEVGEPRSAALAREIREELACEIDVLNWLPGSFQLTEELTLTVAHAILVSGEPDISTDHDLLRWLDADELDGVDWLAADVTFLASVRERLM